MLRVNRVRAKISLEIVVWNQLADGVRPLFNHVIVERGKTTSKIFDSIGPG